MTETLEMLQQKNAKDEKVISQCQQLSTSLQQNIHQQCNLNDVSATDGGYPNFPLCQPQNDHATDSAVIEYKFEVTEDSDQITETTKNT